MEDDIRNELTRIFARISDKVLPWLKETVTDLTDEEGYYETEMKILLTESDVRKVYDEYLNWERKDEDYLRTFFDDFVEDHYADEVERCKEEFFGKVLERAENEGMKDNLMFLVKNKEEYLDGIETLICRETDYMGIYKNYDAIMGRQMLTLICTTEAERKNGLMSISEMSGKDSKENLDNFISYLIVQQGYSVKDLMNARNGRAKGRFIESIEDEINDLGGNAGAYTILVMATGENLIRILDDIANGNGAVSITEKSGLVSGLYNEETGKGGTFNIMYDATDKPLVIPTDMISSVHIGEYCDRANCISVGKAYNYSLTAWQGKIEQYGSYYGDFIKGYKEDIENITKKSEKEKNRDDE